MNEYPSILFRLLIRLVLAGVILIAGWHYFDGLSRVLYPFVILAAAIVVGPAVAQLFGTPAGFLFYPNKHYDRPQPMYGIPEARRKEGNYEEAMEGFRRITIEHPQEVKAWVRMMEIAVFDLHDRARAEAIYQEGLFHLNRNEDKTQLSQMHQAFQTATGHAAVKPS